MASHAPAVDVRLGLLTGGIDKHYALGLATALTGKPLQVDFIGSDEVDCAELHTCAHLRFLNLRGSQVKDAALSTKVRRIIAYYARLIRYAAATRSNVFHILWNNKFQTFDRTILMLYYKLLGKKITFTAHNVNAAKRDAVDSFLNRLTLRIQYRLTDHVFVHTEKMKQELMQDFGVREAAVTVIPYGINNAVPNSSLTAAQAKARLGVNGKKTILFFGRIGAYKGLEFLLEAFARIARDDPRYQLIIAGDVKEGSEAYYADLKRRIDDQPWSDQILQRIGYVPDEDAELYFKGADVLALPYTQIFQSGILFLSYTFGLPVVASDVGAFRDDIVEGRTGFLCRPCDGVDLARALEAYFSSDMYANLEGRRAEIRDYALAGHSWDIVGDMTYRVYTQLLGDPS